MRTDVAVVGAGPAGIAAALAAADLGNRVVLVDAGRAPGGQIYRQPATASAAEVAAVGPKLPERLRRALVHPGIWYLPGTTVWQAVPGSGVTRGADGTDGFDMSQAEFRLWLTTAGRDGAVEPDQVWARAVVIATGASEIVLPFPGWDLPGVTTVGAAQALLKGQGVTAGRRVLVAGSGPLLLPAAAGLAEAGVDVVAVLEANPVSTGAVVAAARLAPFAGKRKEAAAYARILARHRVPVKTGHAVVTAGGDGQVEQATVSRVDRDWRPVPETAQTVGVDAIHVSFGFGPALELSRALGCADLPQAGRPAAAVWCDGDQATSVPGVFAAGETTGVAGADVAELEGYLAGAAAARWLGTASAEFFDQKLGRVRAGLGRARRFARGLDNLYPWRPGGLDWPEPDTVLCRCEEVPWAAIGAAVAAGARDVRAVKGVTRCGMGYCQGRMCGPAVQQAVAAATGRGLAAVGDLGSRPILTPVTLGEIAGSVPPSDQSVGR
jgi:NADPH-dependent 2,4-dienoyl-CoA reductase/sulfur reductase-like enzyme